MSLSKTGDVGNSQRSLRHGINKSNKDGDDTSSNKRQANLEDYSRGNSACLQKVWGLWIGIAG